MALRRLSALLVLATVAVVAAAPPALAHTELESSDPAEGASLSAPPQQVQLTFGETVTLPADPVQVAGPGGAKWTVGKAIVAGRVVTVPVQASGLAGGYVLDYRVISDDGDEVKGAVHFTLTGAGEPSTGVAPSPTQAAPTSAVAVAPAGAGSGGFPVWAWIAIAVAAVAALGGLVVGRLRRS
jgi:methionine-rich copper-binding protein CopC